VDITLITEGTYPHNMGGVSVWCDQLLREMSEHTFELLSISATGTEKSTWELPSNVARVGTIPSGGRHPGAGRPRTAKAVRACAGALFK